jgi:hypothetical protein
MSAAYLVAAVEFDSRIRRLNSIIPPESVIEKIGEVL